MAADTLNALAVVLGSMAIGAILEWAWHAIRDGRNGD